MIDNEIINQAKQANAAQTKPHVCKFCGKGYAKESTLTSHVCEQKRRHQQRNDKGVQMGLQAYLRFYELTQGKTHSKDHSDFAKSSYYSAFVKFGSYICKIDAINPQLFIDYVIKNNIKLDHWTKDKYYEQYLFNYLRVEAVNDALERMIEWATKWAEEHNSEFNHYFLYASPMRFARDVANGRISPWTVYNCDSGIGALEKCGPEQLQMMYHMIDPDFWQKKIMDYPSDAAFVQQVLKEAGF